MPRTLPAVALLVLLGCSHAVPPPSGTERRRFDDPDLAAQFGAMKRGLTAGMDPAALYEAAQEQMALLGRHTTASPRAGDVAAMAADGSVRTLAGWTPLGPGNIGGRTRALQFDPREPRIMYAAAVSGGVWKTTTAGASWAPVGDRLANVAVNSLAIDPNRPSTLWAGTGEGYYREDIRGTALPIRGDGIFVTHDGGGNWTRVAATANNPDFHWINDIVVSPRDSRRVYAATRTGVWRTSDEGSSWKRVLPTTVKGGCTDLLLMPGTAETLFAACGVFEQATVYRAGNAETDAPWSAVLSEPSMSRTTLAYAPSNPSVVYALAAGNAPGPGGESQNLLAVFRSDQGGAAGTWTARVRFDDPDRLVSTLLSNPVTGLCSTNSWSAMGWHANVIAVDPGNPDRVWAGGVDLFRSDDGGRTWGIASYWWTDAGRPQFVHADQHVIAFHPKYDGASNQTLFVANDGGVYRTTGANQAVGFGAGSACRLASAVSWTSLNNGFAATQFYHGAVCPNGQSYAGGTQDNGTLFGSVARGFDGWRRGYGGDGAYVAIDPSDPRYVYAESQFGRLARSSNGGEGFVSLSSALPGPSEFLFVAPIAIDATAPSRLWIGGRQMWRSSDRGSTFAAASTTMPAKVSAFAIAPRNGDHLVAGTASGDIVRTHAATTATSSTSWSTARPREGYVSSIAFDPDVTTTVYATYAGFGGVHVWRSLDGGATWTPLDGSGAGTLPDIPVHSIAPDPTRAGRLYLGTDLGVFVSLDGGTTWMVEESGFGTVITEWVTIAQGATGPAVYAFTHGRGVWRAELSVPVGRRRGTR